MREKKICQGLVDFTKDELISSNNDVGNSFYYQLEQYMFNPKNSKQKDIIIEFFSHGDSNYNILNKTRLEIKADKGELEQSLLSQITQMDFSALSDYYGDLIYYLLINKHPIYDLFTKVHDSKLNKYLYHLSKSYDNLNQAIIDYITNFKFENDIKKVRVNKHLLRYVLLSIDSTNKNYSFLFNRYIKEALDFVNEALKIISTNADLYSIKATILLCMEEYDEAMKILEKGLKTDPNHVDCLYNLAYIYELTGQKNLAFDLYKKILVLTKEETLIRELEDKIDMPLVK